jgi:hypothetical protein
LVRRKSSNGQHSTSSDFGEFEEIEPDPPHRKEPTGMSAIDRDTAVKLLGKAKDEIARLEWRVSHSKDLDLYARDCALFADGIADKMNRVIDLLGFKTPKTSGDKPDSH